MKFSLIVTTQGNRMNEFFRLLESLEEQTYSNFELIVIDQSHGTDVKDACETMGFQKKIISTKSLISLSHARNLGLNVINGDIVAFPDDDCWYPRNLLEQIKSCFDNDSSLDCICCCGYDPDKKRTLSKRISRQDVVNISTINALRYPMSIGIFAKSKSNIRFDEELGAGTKWGSGEESDYILQLLNQQYIIKFYSKILVYHPYNNDASELQAQKSYRYGQGYGALIKKATGRKQRGVLFDYYIVLFRSLGGFILYSLKRDKLSNNYISRIKGMFDGRKNA